MESHVSIALARTSLCTFHYREPEGRANRVQKCVEEMLEERERLSPTKIKIGNNIDLKPSEQH